MGDGSNPKTGGPQTSVRSGFGARMKSKESRRMLFHHTFCRALHRLGEHRTLQLATAASKPSLFLSGMALLKPCKPTKQGDEGSILFVMLIA